MSDVLTTARTLKKLHEAGIVPEYERLLAATYESILKEGDIVFDIGAHSGRHLANFARLVGPSGSVFAFEPLPHMARHLRHIYASDSRVKVLEVALGSARGKTEFVHAINAPEESGLLRRIFNQAGTKTEKISVNLETVDHVAAGLPRLDYIKIDIEGGEIGCLKGATETLSRYRPIMSIEYGHPGYSVYGHTKMTLYDWATGAGYTLSDLFGNLVADAGEWESVCDLASWDYFAVPTEKIDFWTQACGLSPKI